MNSLIFLTVFFLTILGLTIAQEFVYSYTLIRHDGENSLSTAWMYLESTNPNKVTKYFSFSPQKNKSPWSSAPGISTVNDTIRAWPYSAYMTRFITPEQFDKVSQAIDNFYAKEPYYHQSPPVKARNTYNSFTAINHVLRAGGNLQLLDEPYFPDKSSASLGTVSIQLMFVTVAAILAFH